MSTKDEAATLNPAELRAGLIARKVELEQQTTADNASRGAAALKAAQGDVAAGKELAAVDQRKAKAEQEARAIDAALEELDMQERMGEVLGQRDAAKRASEAFPQDAEALRKACAAFEAKAGQLAPLFDAVVAAQRRVNDSLGCGLVPAIMQSGDIGYRQALLLRCEALAAVLPTWLAQGEMRATWRGLTEHAESKFPGIASYLDSTVAKLEAHAVKTEADIRNPGQTQREPTLGEVMAGWSDAKQRARSFEGVTGGAA